MLNTQTGGAPRFVVRENISQILYLFVLLLTNILYTFFYLVNFFFALITFFIHLLIKITYICPKIGLYFIQLYTFNKIYAIKLSAQSQTFLSHELRFLGVIAPTPTFDKASINQNRIDCKKVLKLALGDRAHHNVAQFFVKKT